MDHSGLFFALMAVALGVGIIVTLLFGLIVTVSPEQHGIVLDTPFFVNSPISTTLRSSLLSTKRDLTEQITPKNDPA